MVNSVLISFATMKEATLTQFLISVERDEKNVCVSFIYK